MNEFEYDSYLKKNIAHSAARRRGGSKSRRCPLSTDHMTRKQWEERCGTVMSYHIGSPMAWADFIQLPKDLKEEYMNNLIHKYSANARNMADMFGVSVATVFRLVKKEGLHVEFLKGRHPAGNKQAEFQKFLSGDPDQEFADERVNNETGAEICEFDDPEERSEDQSSNESRRDNGRLDGFTMSFSNVTDVEMIANSLRYILGSNRRAKIQIICEIE